MAYAIGEPVPMGRPRALAVHYGWPSRVNGAAGDLSKAVEEFNCFAAVVLGDLPMTETADPDSRAMVDRLLNGRAVYGYVSLGPGTGRPERFEPALEARFERWMTLGATGLFLDCAGRDYGVSARRLSLAVRGAHLLGVPVAINAWDPRDLLDGHLPLSAGDAYVSENDVLRDGRFRPLEAFAEKLALAQRCREILGVDVWGIGTVAPGTSGYDEHLAVRLTRAWLWARVDPPDLLAIADPLYGASDDRLLVPGTSVGAAWDAPLREQQHTSEGLAALDVSVSIGGL